MMMKVRISLFSFPFRKFIFLLCSILFILVVMFGCMVVAHAEPMTFTPDSASYVNPLYQNPFSPSISLVNNVGYQNLGAYYFAITNPGADSYNFTYHYNATNYCSSTGYKGSAVFQYSLEGGVSGSNISVVYDNQTSGITTQKNGTTITIPTLDFSKGVKFVFNSSGGQATGLYIDRGWNITCATDPNQSVIDNNNQNTQDIINNNNNNTNTIINNQNQNTQDMIDSNKICKNFNIDKSSISTLNKWLHKNGTIQTATNYGITDYFYVNSNSILTLTRSTSDTNVALCFYDDSFNVISCVEERTISLNSTVPIPTGATKVRFSVGNNGSFDNRPNFTLYSCYNGNQAINDSLTDDNVSSALTTGNGFFDNFTIDDSRGFSQIVIAPIQFLRDLLTSSSSCQPLSLSFNPSDGVHSGAATWSIPCGEVLWSKAPNGVVLLWYTLIYGLLGYRVLIDMVRFINRTINPEDTSEYVMDL